MSRLLIDDKALEQLDRHVSPGRTQENLVELACSRIGHVAPNERYLLLTEADLNTIARRLGVPVIGTAKDLWQAIDQLADIKIGNVSLDFTAAQYREIQDRANREQQKPVDTIRRIVAGMHSYFFTTAPVELPVIKKAS